MQRNLDIRKAAENAGIKLWQIAQVYGCNDSAFSRKLRNELSEFEKARIMAIIQKLWEELTPCEKAHAILVKEYKDGAGR